ncbi:hypothetical protein AAMO2058_001601200 [Amorphochlora amoebiformis]
MNSHYHSPCHCWYYAENSKYEITFAEVQNDKARKELRASMTRRIGEGFSLEEAREKALKDRKSSRKKARLELLVVSLRSLVKKLEDQIQIMNDRTCQLEDQLKSAKELNEEYAEKIKTFEFEIETEYESKMQKHRAKWEDETRAQEYSKRGVYMELKANLEQLTSDLKRLRLENSGYQMREEEYRDRLDRCTCGKTKEDGDDQDARKQGLQLGMSALFNPRLKVAALEKEIKALKGNNSSLNKEKKKLKRKNQKLTSQIRELKSRFLSINNTDMRGYRRQSTQNIETKNPPSPDLNRKPPSHRATSSSPHVDGSTVHAEPRAHTPQATLPLEAIVVNSSASEALNEDQNNLRHSGLSNEPGAGQLPREKQEQGHIPVPQESARVGAGWIPTADGAQSSKYRRNPFTHQDPRNVSVQELPLHIFETKTLRVGTNPSVNSRKHGKHGKHQTPFTQPKAHHGHKASIHAHLPHTPRAFSSFVIRGFEAKAQERPQAPSRYDQVSVVAKSSRSNNHKVAGYINRNPSRTLKIPNHPTLNVVTPTLGSKEPKDLGQEDTDNHHLSVLKSLVTRIQKSRDILSVKLRKSSEDLEEKQNLLLVTKEDHKVEMVNVRKRIENLEQLVLKLKMENKVLSSQSTEPKGAHMTVGRSRRTSQGSRKGSEITPRSTRGYTSGRESFRANSEVFGENSAMSDISITEGNSRKNHSSGSAQTLSSPRQDSLRPNSHQGNPARVGSHGLDSPRQANNPIPGSSIGHHHDHERKNYSMTNETMGIDLKNLSQLVDATTEPPSTARVHLTSRTRTGLTSRSTARTKAVSTGRTGYSSVAQSRLTTPRRGGKSKKSSRPSTARSKAKKPPKRAGTKSVKTNFATLSGSFVTDPSLVAARQRVQRLKEENDTRTHSKGGGFRGVTKKEKLEGIPIHEIRVCGLVPTRANTKTPTKISETFPPANPSPTEIFRFTSTEKNMPILNLDDDI